MTHFGKRHDAGRETIGMVSKSKKFGRRNEEDLMKDDITEAEA